MALEFAADAGEKGDYPFPVRTGGHDGSTTEGTGPLVLDWQPMLDAILADVQRGVGAPLIAARFHNALANVIVETARLIGAERVALSGGCFQNRLLTELAAARLRAAGHEALLHRQTPPNDGGVALGQVAVAALVLT
jgi:hydrogenase maturation protein HypF